MRVCVLVRIYKYMYIGGMAGVLKNPFQREKKETKKEQEEREKREQEQREEKEREDEREKLFGLGKDKKNGKAQILKSPIYVDLL